MASHTIQLYRVLRAPPDRGYRAFLDVDAKNTNNQTLSPTSTLLPVSADCSIA